MGPSCGQHRNLSPADVRGIQSPPPRVIAGTMPPSSRMNLASLLQPESETLQRRPANAAPATPAAPSQLPPPPTSYTPSEPPPPSSYSHHGHPSNYPSSNSNQNYSGSSQYSHGYPPPASQPSHSYHPSSYTTSPTHTSQAPAHHSHPFHSHAHHHSHPHPHSGPPGHSHLSHPQHPHHHTHTHHAHQHQHSHSHSHPHSHPHPHHALPHSHVHVIHNHHSASGNPPSGAQPPAPLGPPSSAGSPPYSASHGPASTRGPQPIIPIPSAPRSPVANYQGTRSPTAPYSIYGAGSILSGGRRSPEFSSSGPPHPGSSSGSRRNTLTGPQPIDPLPLRDYPPYAPKHPDDYPSFSAPVYGSRPESPQTSTGGKNRRTGGGASTSSRIARSASVKRSLGGAGEVNRAADRSRERDKNERELDKEREDHLYREKLAMEREREERAREREYDEQRALAREREREREERRVQHELDMRDRRPPPTKRTESEFVRRQPDDWDQRMRERDRDRGRMPREPERDWRREQEDPRTLVPSKHISQLSAHGYPDGKQSHLHPLQQTRSAHHYAQPTPPPASLPILSPVWLGTHVYPNLPFPVCLPPALSRNNLSPEGYRPYQYTILVPSAFLPLQPAARVPRPAIPLWGSTVTGYTDDSNLLLAAVHSGRTNWSDIRRAKRLRHDAKIIVGIWVGGANGGRNAVRPKGGAWEGGQGSGQLYSSSWGNSHDGGGMEIVEVIWMEDSAHGPHRPNRRERMEQYAKRRADLDLVPPVKRDRIDTWYLDSDDEDAQISVPAKRTWDVGETIVFGKGGTTSGFVYDPHALRSVVFEESNERSTKRLKSKSKQPNEEDQTVICRRDIVLENDDEQYILSLNKSKTYTLSTLSPKSKKTEVLRKSVTEEDVSFFDKGLCVWIKDDEAKDKDGEKQDKDAELSYDETMSNDRKGWFCRVNRWKFAPDTEPPTTTVDAS
ncbi:hypothetical protein ACGC1H_003677 [Rhizoctonia solani]